MITENYQLLDELYSQILAIKEELVEIDVQKEHFNKVDKKLTEIANERQELENTRKILELIRTVPKARDIPGITVQYSHLHNQIYEPAAPIKVHEPAAIVIQKMLKSNLLYDLQKDHCEESKKYAHITN